MDPWIVVVEVSLCAPHSPHGDWLHGVSQVIGCKLEKLMYRVSHHLSLGFTLIVIIPLSA